VYRLKRKIIILFHVVVKPGLEAQRIRMCENRILRRIFRPKREALTRCWK